MPKKKHIEFDVNENGCFVCTSHKGDSDGYPDIHHKGKRYKGYRLIYQECFGEVPEGLVVRHKCDNRSCINPEHLEIGTWAENSRDMVVRNRSLKGEKNYQSKFTNEQVREIKSLKGKISPKEIANKFKRPLSTIENVLYGQSWTHIA